MSLLFLIITLSSKIWHHFIFEKMVIFHISQNQIFEMV